MGTERSGGLGRRTLLWIGAVLGAGALVAGGIAISQPGSRTTQAAAGKASGSLTAFRSDAELRQFLRRIRTQHEPADNLTEDMAMPMSAPPAAAPPAPAEAGAPVARMAQPSITNTQEANVDEGGIVKVSGDNLVILRRGRLFTVNLAGGGMRADRFDQRLPARRFRRGRLV